MTKQLFNLASCIRRAWVRRVTVDTLKVNTHVLCVQEQIISLTAEEASFVALETRRLLRAQRLEAKRKKRLGIPPPPEPGKIAYAVYM